MSFSREKIKILNSSEKEALMTQLLDTDKPSSALSNFLTADKLSPQRFADKPDVSFRPSIAFKETLSEFFTRGQSDYKIEEGAWITILKRQIALEVELGLIATENEGKDRIKSIFIEFTNAINTESAVLEKIAESNKDEYSSTLHQCLIHSLPDKFKENVAELAAIAEDKEIALVLNELKCTGENVTENFKNVLENFITLRNQVTPHSEEEAKNYLQLTKLIGLLSATITMLADTKPENPEQTVRLGLIMAALNKVCSDAAKKQNYDENLRDLVGYLRGIKNDGIKNIDNLKKVKLSLTGLFKQGPHKLKNIIRDQILIPFFPEYKKIPDKDIAHDLLGKTLKISEITEKLVNKSIKSASLD